MSKVRNLKGHLVIDVLQEKTKKEVTIPMMDSKAIEIFSKQLQRSISLQKLNKYIKEVCRILGIDEIIEGNIIQIDQ
jgi:hypothetical protein